MNYIRRKEFAARYFAKVKKKRLLSLSHFNSQWLEFIYINGCHPIVCNRPKKEDRIPGVNYHFQFRLFSWITLYTTLVISSTILCFLNWFIELQYEGGIETLVEEYYRNRARIGNDDILSVWTWGNRTHDKPLIHLNQLDSLTQLCLVVCSKFIPLSGCVYMISASFATPNLIMFLNSSNEFENRIRKLFPDVVDISLAHLHYFRQKIALGNTCIFLVFMLAQTHSFYFIIHYSNNILESKLLLVLLMVCVIGFHGLFDDTKALILLKMVEEYFQQINDGVSNYKKERSGGVLGILQDIKKWRSLVQLVRQQAKIAASAMQGSTVSALFAIHLVLTTSTYLIYCVIYKDLPEFIGRYAILSLVYCSVVYLRLYLKAVLAESISKKENELAETLRLFGDCPVDTKFAAENALHTSAQVEASFITDPIISKPTECVLNSCVILKVTLLLGIFRNVSTYAVALMQLDNVQTSISSIEQ